MKFKKIMLGLGVGILAALFIGFFIEALYPAPQYENYCSNQGFPMAPKIGEQENCSFEYNTTFRNECLQEGGRLEEVYDEDGCVIEEECNLCFAKYQEAEKEYNSLLFYITAPIGLLMIILGLYLPTTIDAIAGGFLFGGILTMIQITMRVFGALDSWPRVILLGAELVIVIWIGIKKVNDGFKWK